MKMENEIRRTLDELVARYVLEPDLRDIYDYSCLEMYLFNETVLNKVLLLSLRISELTAINILNQLSKVSFIVYLRE